MKESANKTVTKQAKFLVCVSDKDHSKTALKFSLTKADKSKCLVEMLCVIDPVDYNTIFSVADVIKKDRKLDASRLLKQLKKDSQDWSKTIPKAMVREGRIIEEIITIIEKDPAISMLIIGVAPDGSSSKSGLLSQLTSAIGEKYNIPLLLVPGNLTDEQIKALC